MREMDIERNIQEVTRRIALACKRAGRSPEEVTLVAITKTIGPAAIRAAFQAGLRHFGENRVQEAKPKLGELENIRTQCTWHMVGHLQTNKAKTAGALFDIIQSVDSVRLAEFLSRHAQKTIPILLEVNIAGEASKSGFSTGEVFSAMKEIGRMPKLEIKGLMTIAPLASDPEEVRPVFRRLRELRNSMGLDHLSMGMTDDFEVAIEEGSTMVRIGRAIFGERR
ncbi:YggS family pyridoxal phosphate-dependent enzyme [Dehalococcoidia bacterium]|nr:YggS family pyridoxal phosphate-dependent enzyme [Dehalococcoidia bacterium]MCL0090790.1 YggS family pyridoxal phosphate-dependent enzyme [Dehalococcoidia bacterium]